MKRGAIVLALLAACAHRGAPGSPAEATTAFADAVGRGDADVAYRAMSPEYRARVPYDRFREQIAAFDAQDVARLHRFATSVQGTIEVRPVGESLAVPMTAKGGWALAALPIEPFGQATPEDALRTFVRAASRRRYDVLLRLVPERERGVVTLARLRDHWEGSGAADAAALVGELRLHLDDPVVTDGERATLTYAAAGRTRVVRLVREDGAWRLERVD